MISYNLEWPGYFLKDAFRKTSMTGSGGHGPSLNTGIRLRVSRNVEQKHRGSNDALEMWNSKHPMGTSCFRNALSEGNKRKNSYYILPAGPQLKSTRNVRKTPKHDFSRFLIFPYFIHSVRHGRMTLDEGRLFLLNYN